MNSIILIKQAIIIPYTEFVINVIFDFNQFDLHVIIAIAAGYFVAVILVEI